MRAPGWYHDLAARTRSLLRTNTEERDMDDEMRFHLDMETRRHERAGLPPDEARRRAERDFGSVMRYKDEVRDARGTRGLEDLLQDTRFAWRTLLRRKGFTVVAVLTLALGIGVTTTLFGVVRSVLLAPLPWGSPDGVAVVWSAWKGFDRTWLSYDEWEAWRAEIPAFADVALFSDGTTTIAEGNGDPELLRAGFVAANVFPVLQVAPALGRGFTIEEDTPDGPRAVVLGHELWQRRFAGDPKIIGREILVGGERAPVVGVMPPGFRLPLDYGAQGATQLWIPIAANAEQEGAIAGAAMQQGGGNHGFYAVARLRAGSTAADANRQLAERVAQLVRDGTYPPAMQFRAFTVPIAEQVTGRVRPVLLVVFAAVGLVMLIACANVAGLLLVRGEARRREMAVRVAIGIGMPRLIRLLITESVLLAALGGALGIALAMAGTWLVRISAPAGLARVADTRIDGGVLLFALAAASLAAVLSGLLPALQATRVAPASALRDGGRSATAGVRRLRWRQTLVTIEIALAVVLVAGAGLMIRSVANLFAIDTGFRSENVLTVRVTTPATWYPDSVRVAGFWDELQRRVAALPGVDAVGAARLLPLASEMGDYGMGIEGYTPPPNQGTPGDWQVVTPGYFEAMGLVRRTGRVLDTRDGMDAPLAMVVNRTLVKRYLEGRDPIGVRVKIGGPAQPWYTIVGVVDDVHHNGLTTEVKPQFYVTLAQFAKSPGNTRRAMSLVVHTTGDPTALIGRVRATVRALDPRLPVSEIRTMDEIVGSSIAEPRFAMGLLGVFGLIALVLSAIGVFGIVAQVVAMRSHEFGIRAALGASPRRLMMLGFRVGATQAAAGLAIGVALALVLTRTLSAFLHGVAPADPMTFALVLVVTGLVAVVASTWPARRAARVDPAMVLQES